MMNFRLRHLFYGLLLGMTLSAQTVVAQNNSTVDAATAAKMERVEVERWRKANPTVKVISPSRLATLPAADQAMYRNSSSALILRGAKLSAIDIQDYEANKRRLPAYNSVAEYERANPTRRNTSASSAKKDLERLRLSDPQAYKAQIIRSNPPRTNPPRTNTVSTLSRSKYNALPADRRALIDQNPTQYRIVD
jgi:hypothetical protein